MQAKARGNPAAFDHFFDHFCEVTFEPVLILMPTLFRLNELSGTGEEQIEKQKPERKEVFKELREI